MKLRALLQILVLLLFALPNAKGANDGPSRTGDDLFAKANTEFAAGNFKAAIADYQAVVDSGEWSANLFYDLGNAYFRHGDFGRAILNYDRALRLDPHHPEADANLRIAHDQAHSLELAPSALEKYLNFGTANFFAIVAAIFFWLAIICLILRPGRVLWADSRYISGRDLRVRCLHIGKRHARPGPGNCDCGKRRSQSCDRR